MKNLFYSTVACMALLFTASCDSDNIEPQLKADFVIPEPNEGENSTFVSNLFRKAVNEDLQNGKANTLVSPLSINFALGMLVNGAEGETKDEIMNALGYKDLSIDQVNEYSQGLANILTSNADESVSFSIANSIWYATDFTIKDAFVQTNKTFYDAEVNEIDFRSPDALSTINKWCSDKTKNKIPKALGQLNEDTKTILINALYFKSPWRYEFYESFTKKNPFYAEDGSSAEVDIMHTGGIYRYKSDSYAEYLELPFGNYKFDEAYNMIVILPNEGKTVQEVFNYVDYDPSWTSNNSRSHVLLSLPKFKIDFSYNLEEYILPEMGMKIPFTHNANFNGIGPGLFVSKVIHKTTIDVNEYGVEAAAITIVGMETSNGNEPTYKDFNVNRPFMFSICEKTTGTVLFVGKIGKIVE